MGHLMPDLSTAVTIQHTLDTTTIQLFQNNRGRMTNPAIPPALGTTVTIRHTLEQTMIVQRIPPGQGVDVWRIGVAGSQTLMEWDGGVPSSLHVEGYSSDPL
jgi:hypothetical protein